jgi:hypothetical protein
MPDTHPAIAEWYSNLTEQGKANFWTDPSSGLFNKTGARLLLKRILHDFHLRHAPQEVKEMDAEREMKRKKDLNAASEDKAERVTIVGIYSHLYSVGHLRPLTLCID